jgi:hypothetical protein
MYRCISNCTMLASSMLISLYHSIFLIYQNLKILCLRSWQAGKTIISGDPFPCIHLLLFYFIGYVHCNMLWTLLELCIICLRFNFAATYSIPLPSTLSPPNLKIWWPGHPVHSLFR